MLMHMCGRAWHSAEVMVEELPYKIIKRGVLETAEYGML